MAQHGLGGRLRGCCELSDGRGLRLPNVVTEGWAGGREVPGVGVASLGSYLWPGGGLLQCQVIFFPTLL